MKQINTLFDRMDAWRHLPNYQLERRADLFFSLYLPEVLEAKLGFPVADQIVPEFPVRIGTIYPDIPIDKSYKIESRQISSRVPRDRFPSTTRRCARHLLCHQLETEIFRLT